MSQKSVAAIVVAAGRGERANTAGSLPKQYQPVGGKAILVRSLEAMLAHPGIGVVLPVVSSEHQRFYDSLALSNSRLLPNVSGGSTRQQSVLAGLEALAPHRPDLVLIHDAARPFVDRPTIDGVLTALINHDGAVPVLPVTDTIKRTRDGVTVAATEDRASLFAAQTPQGFRFPQILSASMRAAALPGEFTDDAAIAEWAGLSVALTPGSADNFKITRPEDFLRAESLLGQGRQMETRVGSGFDVHPFAPGDHVWLGGVRIPHDFALAGHSDADAALHALADALYGALGEGDIGTHFPPSDMRWRGERSTTFIAHAADLVRQRGGWIVNLDLTLVCEAPRIGPHVVAMRDTIGAACGVAASRVAVKATTSERLGFTGRREGVVAMATASIQLPAAD